MIVAEYPLSAATHGIRRADATLGWESTLLRSPQTLTSAFSGRPASACEYCSAVIPPP